MSQVSDSRNKLVSGVRGGLNDSQGKADTFGNPIDPVVGFARGSIIRSSIEEALRLRHAQAIASQRVKASGVQSIGVFTGNQRYFPINPDDIATVCEEWVGPGLCAEELRQVAIEHMGGQADDETAVFNRTSAGIIATIAALASGKPVVSVVPPGGRSHVSAVRGAKIAGIGFVEIQADRDWRQAMAQNHPALVVVTTVTSSLELLEDRISVEIIQYARSLGAKVFLDEAYGARLRPTLHGGQLSLQLGADISITNTDKAGLSGPRAGVLVGRRDLVTAAGAKGAEFGMEARAPIVAAALRSLEKYCPGDLQAEAAAGQELAAALEKELGRELVQTSDLGPMVGEDAVLQVMMERAGLGGQTPVVVPSEATAALGMILLRDYGVLTVNTHGQPGARVSLRLKPTLNALSRVGGIDLVVHAVTESLDKVARIINDHDGMARLILGASP